MEQSNLLYPDGCVFQEDNDPKHRYNLARGFMEEKGKNRMDWSACSPVLNLIENLCSMIKREIELMSPRNLMSYKRK